MRTRVVLAVSFCWAVNWPILAEQEGLEQLQRLERQLRDELSNLEEVDYSYKNKGSSLIVQFRTRPFMIHGQSKSGERSRDAHEVTGPSYQGFLLRIHLQAAGTVNQAMVPQTIREPYWMTDLNVYPLDEAKQVYVACSYGNRLDKKVHKRLAAFWERKVRDDRSVVRGARQP